MESTSAHLCQEFVANGKKDFGPMYFVSFIGSLGSWTLQKTNTICMPARCPGALRYSAMGFET